MSVPFIQFGGGKSSSGTVTSVTFTGDGTVLSSTPSSAVTTSGTLTAALASANANTVLGNATGSSAAPTYTGAPVVTSLTCTDTSNNNDLVIQNTTTGTVSTTNASPLAELAANYWTGAASASDTWTIGSSLAAGANGASTLAFTHAGSTGTAKVQIPAGSAGHNSLVFGSNSTGFYGGASLVGIDISSTSGAALVLNAGSTTIYEVINSTGTTGFVVFNNRVSGEGTHISGSITTTATPAVLVSNNAAGNGNFTGTSGTQTGLSIGQGSTTPSLIFAPTSGSAAFVACNINPQINQTSTSSGNYTALQVAVVETSLKGSSNLLINALAGTSGATSKFSVDNSGNLVAAGGIALDGNTAEGAGTINANTYYAAGTIGLTETGTALTSITTVGGLVTATSDVSDERLKEGKRYQGGLTEVLKISPMKFRWNEEGQKETGLTHGRDNVGFYAQNIQKAIPEAVWEGKTGYLAFDDRPVVAALVNAVKELNARIAYLEASPAGLLKRFWRNLWSMFIRP